MVHDCMTSVSHALMTKSRNKIDSHIFLIKMPGLEVDVPYSFVVSIIRDHHNISYGVRFFSNDVSRNIWGIYHHNHLHAAMFNRTELIANIKHHVFDDYKSVYVIDRRFGYGISGFEHSHNESLMQQYLVRDEDITKFLCDILVNDCVNNTLIRKNKLKITSSQYGAQLFDICVTCIND